MRIPKLLMGEVVASSVNHNIDLTQAKRNYFTVLAESNENKFEENGIVCVGDGPVEVF